MTTLDDLSLEELQALRRQKRRHELSTLTDEQLKNEKVQSDVKRALAPPAPTWVDKAVGHADDAIMGVAEPIMQMGKSVATLIPKGWAGLAKTITSGPEEGEKTMKAFDEKFVGQPKTDAGYKGMQNVQKAVGPFMEPWEALNKKIGDTAFKKTGNNPYAGAAGATALDAVTQMTGYGAVKKGLKTQRLDPNTKLSRKALEKAAPTQEALFAEAKSGYDAVSEVAGNIQPSRFESLIDDINEAATSAGAGESFPSGQAFLKELNELSPETRRLNPVTGAYEKSREGGTITIKRLLELRTQAQNMMKDGVSKSVGKSILDEIDDFFAHAKETDFYIPEGSSIPGSKVGKMLTEARDRYARAKRSETIQDHIRLASDTQKGTFDEQIRKSIANLIDDRKKSRFLTDHDKETLRKEILNSSGPLKMGRLLGRLGFSPASQTNIYGGVLGYGIGHSLFGGVPGGFSVLVSGSISREIVNVLMKGKAEFADAVIRAGDKAGDVLKAYNKYVPRAKQNAHDLSLLIMRGDMDWSSMPKNARVKEAVILATEKRKALTAAVISGAALQEAKSISSDPETKKRSRFESMLHRNKQSQ